MMRRLLHWLSGALASPYHLERFVRAVCPDYGFGRCDGHHEKIDFRSQKARTERRCLSGSQALQEPVARREG
jgi:hypothetical protein